MALDVNSALTLQTLMMYHFASLKIDLISYT